MQLDRVSDQNLQVVRVEVARMPYGVDRRGAKRGTELAAGRSPRRILLRE